MAYLDLSLVPSLGLGCGGAAPGLTRLERVVVRLALRDPRRTLDRVTATDRLVQRLFGIRRPAPLACPRLEALRRHVVLLRHEGVNPADMLRLRGAGFTPGAVAEVHARVLVERVRGGPSATARMAARLAPLAHGMARLGTAWLEGGIAGAVALLALPLLKRF